MLEVDIKFSQGRMPIQVKFKLNNTNAGIFGPSSCGKSCLLKMLAGTLRPDAGRIILDKKIVFDSQNNINLLAKHPAITLISAETQINEEITIRENLLALNKPKSKNNHGMDFSTIVDLLQLENLLDFRAKHLSSSERQRILLGRGLLSGARLLLLDDALSFLDERIKLQIYCFLRYAHEKHRIKTIYSASRLSDALKLTDFLILMAKGDVLVADFLQQIVTNQHLLKLESGLAIDNILSVIILDHDPDYGCTLAMFFGIHLVLPYTPRTLRGGAYYVGLRSQDIALSTHLIEGISIQNQIKGRVCAIISRLDRVLIQVDAGSTLTVDITLKAFASLNIQENDMIYCLIKTHSFRFLVTDHQRYTA